MMSTSFFCARKPILLLAASLAAAAGCRAPQTTPAPAAAGPAETAASRDDRLEWWMIYHVQVVNSQRTRNPAGYLERWLNREGKIKRYWVRDLANQMRGFLLPEFQAFQLVESRDIFGKLVNESKTLGNSGLEGGIQRILEIAEGSIEVEKMSEYAKPPAPAAPQEALKAP